MAQHIGKHQGVPGNQQEENAEEKDSSGKATEGAIGKEARPHGGSECLKKGFGQHPGQRGEKQGDDEFDQWLGNRRMGPVWRGVIMSGRIFIEEIGKALRRGG
jgi:hypothetical protein